jgi:predicted phage tail protein
MSVGTIFYLIALILFFLAGIGATVIPAATIWGLFSLTLGMLLSGVAIPVFPRQP